MVNITYLYKKQRNHQTQTGNNHNQLGMKIKQPIQLHNKTPYGQRKEIFSCVKDAPQNFYQWTNIIFKSFYVKVKIVLEGKSNKEKCIPSQKGSQKTVFNLFDFHMGKYIRKF